MYAVFSKKGKLDIYDSSGDPIVSGNINKRDIEEDRHPMLDYAIALMKNKGDWPENPYENKLIRLED